METSTNPIPKQKTSLAQWTSVIFRLLIGALFILSGFSKLMQPREEFMAIIATYQLLPNALIPVYALVLPWVEIISGIFFFLGWYTKQAGALILLMLLSFIVALGYVLIREIPLTDCGCFGNKVLAWLGETPTEILLRDVILFGITVLILRSGSFFLSFDAWFLKKSLS